VEHAELKILIIMLRHLTNIHAKQASYIIVTQVARALKYIISFFP
jgi:hypothetical protein